MSGMHLLPAYYTTNNTRKRKQREMTKKQKASLKKHNRFLRKMGLPEKDSGVAPKLNKSKLRGIGNSIPSYEIKREYVPSKGNGIGNGLKRDNTEQLRVSSEYTIAPAYNKGAYQVIGEEYIKDIGR